MNFEPSARMNQDLLIEIGTEELPPASLLDLERAFVDGITAQLAGNGIGHGTATPFCTPRRLAVLVAAVEERQPDRTTLRRGPAVAVAFAPDGLPSKALMGFARSCGVTVGDLERERTEKGEWFVFRSADQGQATTELVPAMIEQTLAGLPIAKRMRWGTGEAEFVRPVHWVCVVFGELAVPGRVLGVEANRQTYGHRFHAPGPMAVKAASHYPGLLREQGFVEPCFQRRRTLIAEQVLAIAAANEVTVELPARLLDEVTALVEWPRALFGSFDEEFLTVPPEVLIETMQKNQKYFAVRDRDGRLRPNFIGVSNIESKRPELVVQGNERVIRPRFADAMFFWEQDLRQPLEAYFERLEAIVYQDRLGSIGDRCRRVAGLAGRIAKTMEVPPALVERAAMLAKCDLATAMVGEFPSLQGTMGRYYARHAGENPEVCAAIEEQYLPRFSGDMLPTSRCGVALALADRLDLLVGTFGIGQRPTGAKDPYGLRRAAISAVRMLIETPVDLDLADLLAAAQAAFPDGVLDPAASAEVLTYVLGRLEGYFAELGIPPDSVQAVLAAGGSVLSQLERRVRAVQSFRDLPGGLALAAANKRIGNILAKSGVKLGALVGPDDSLFSDDAERQLWARVESMERTSEPLMEVQDFGKVLERLAELRDDVDRFFEQVMVMVQDPLVRHNRLVILKRLQGLFLHVADVSLLQ